jgi:hypothetical protein
MRRRQVQRGEQFGESRGGMRPHLGKKEGYPLRPLTWFVFLHTGIIA